MHRAQILLDEGQFRQLQQVARGEKKTLSQLVREWLGERLDKRQRSRDPLASAAGILRGHVKPTDSTQIDDYLYDTADDV